MPTDFGNGVSRTLSAQDRQFQVVVWQTGKPPLDSELNLMAQVDWERLAETLRAQAHSGFLLDPFKADADYVTDVNWSNWFKFGPVEEGGESPVVWACVNGWMVPVAGTAAEEGDLSNRINLYPGPSSDTRTDFVFLEVFLAQVAPNASTENKPSASTLYRFGNVGYGGTNISDDLQDPNIGFETTERVQLQYRLRLLGSGTGLGDSVDLAAYPDGLDDPNVLAQGTASDPQVGFTWENMRETLGDPGLWRSGNGDVTNALGTVDGYTYAIPVCAVFRRNTNNFMARTVSGNANQCGALDRNPHSAALTDPVEATRTFTGVTLTSALGYSDTGVVQVEGLADSGLDNSDLDWDSVFISIDGEVVGISSISTATTPGTITIRSTGRGRNGTQAAEHDAGAGVLFYNPRPDGRFADSVDPLDILDLRRGVSLGQWDYQQILKHNLGKVFDNRLRSSYKMSGASDTQGPVVLEVDTLYANPAAIPNQTEALDGPDGIRTVFSDAAVVQNNVTVLLKPGSGSSGVPVEISDYTSGASSWEMAAGFIPDGMQSDGDGWADGTVIRLFIGGSTGNDGARKTVRTSADNAFVRFVTPRELWLSRDEILPVAGVGASGFQTPVQLRFLDQAWGSPVGGDEPVAGTPGPMFPLPEHNFERPFIVLGGIVHSDLRTTTADTLVAGSSPSGLSQVRFAGLDFDVAGGWYPSGDVDSLATVGVTNLCLHGSRNLFDLLTAGGRDLTGASSELYLVLTGDDTNAENVGVFRVVGAGTVGYTTESGATSEDLVVERVGTGSAALVVATGLTAEVRSQYTHTEDETVSADGSALAIVLTEAAPTEVSSPWNGLVTLPSTSQMVLDCTLLYGPSRGGMARVPDRIHRIALAGVDTAVLVRESPTVLDSDFDDDAGVAAGEVYFPAQHIQYWNRLPSLGLSAPWAPAYGDGAVLGEQRRDAEAFVDVGSRTLVLRPYQKSALTLNRHQLTAGATNRLFPEFYTAGDFSGGSVDGGGLFTDDADFGYEFPHEFMPRLGRQDIPFHQTAGSAGPVFYGVNHLFADSQTDADDVFRVVGGPDSDSEVLSIFFQTGSTSGRDYGEYFNMGIPGTDGYQARLYEDVNVISTDLPRGLKGIQLPPFLGVARIYGVYDLRDFSGQGAWDPDRVTKSTAAGRPTNLLREDVSRQTLFIVKGGASDVTGSTEDHTYVIPENLIDIRRSDSYTAGQTFEELEYVVECVVFGFARGFITQNNYLLARKNLPSGDTGEAVAALAEDVAVILPLPLPYNEQVYIAYERTVYQGDPYMTRDGATRTESDYEHRYGQIPVVSSSELATPIQQFDSTEDYAQVPETQNPRVLEILATLDFFTTLGTGKIGGKVYPGTLLDVGHLTFGPEGTHVPEASDSPSWQPQVRTYTQPLSESAPRASLVLRVLVDATVSAGEAVRLARGSESVVLVSNTDFSGASVSATASSLADAINNSLEAQNILQVSAVWDGGATVTLQSYLAGTAGTLTQVHLGPVAGNRVVAGFSLGNRPPYGQGRTTSYLLMGEVLPAMNALQRLSATTPVRMAGLTERLPLGILLQDSDFLGEDPLRNGSSSLILRTGGGVLPNVSTPSSSVNEYARLQATGDLALSDGSILEYTAWTLSTTSGTKNFRLYRGGGSAYVMGPGLPGGPVDFATEGFGPAQDPILKGAGLVGRAYLVRNYSENAYAGDELRSHGDEIQMVIVTAGVSGKGPLCKEGYTLGGQISPTGYGEGLCAADRYRIEGKLLDAGHSRTAPDPDVFMAPYQSVDDSDPDAC